MLSASFIRLLGLAAALIFYSVSSYAQVTDTALANAAADNAQWLSYGRDQGETRYSPLIQINDSNVDELGMAWTFDT